MSVYNFFSCSVFLVVCFLSLIPMLYSVGLGSALESILFSDFFIFDGISFYLCVLVIFLGIYTLCMNKFSVGNSTLFFLSISLFFSVLCFCVNHVVLFWCFYELSMLPLLYLIFQDSPYSERFIAGWYFSVYLLITSLPLILILLYLSYLNESLYISGWAEIDYSLWVCICLSLVFFTKVPLCPFHTWLPIVHAEATSIVSIFLSGYIMKLGLLGVYRCVPFLFSGGFLAYFYVCCVFSVFFILTSSSELDGKRWLAFLSLSHIVVPFLAFFVCGWDNMQLSFLFCLGHGLSAGFVFGLLWLFYDITNSRNWLILKAGVSNKVLMFILVFGLLSLCSFPPTIQFFCEVFLVTNSVGCFIYLFFWVCYLFFGGLIPLILCGHTLIRVESVETNSYYLYTYFMYLGYLFLWCYLGILVF